MTNFVWSVNTLERHTATGIVYNALFSVKAVDDAYSVSADGNVILEAPAEGATVIPYAELTEEIVIGWIKAGLGGDSKINEIHQSLQMQLNEQRQPTKASGKPW